MTHTLTQATRRRPTMRITAMVTAFSIVAVACGDDAPSSTKAGSSTTPGQPEAAAPGFEPELVAEDAAVGGGGSPPLIGVTFTNRTDVDLGLALAGRSGADDAENSYQNVTLEADGKGRYAAVLINPVDDFLFGFQLEHTDWIGRDNVYYYFPGYGTDPAEGCDQKQPDVSGAVYVDENSRIGRMALRSGLSPKPMWTIEFTEPNTQGYQGKLTLTNGAKADGSKLEFSCYFNMYTSLQILQRRNALSAAWEGMGLLYQYILEVPIAVGVGGLGQLIGNEGMENWGNNIIKDAFDIDHINSKILDIGHTAAGFDESMKKLAKNDPKATGKRVDSGFIVQQLGPSVAVDQYWDAVSAGVDESTVVVDAAVIEARSVVAAAGS